MVSVNVKQHRTLQIRSSGDVCESWGGHPGLPVPNNWYGLCEHKATLKNRGQEVCESWGGRHRLPVPNSWYGLCDSKATLEECGDRVRSTMVTMAFWLAVKHHITYLLTTPLESECCGYAPPSLFNQLICTLEVEDCDSIHASNPSVRRLLLLDPVLGWEQGPSLELL